MKPLEDCEQVVVDGVTYEAFYTSGGLGTLPQSFLGRVENLSYKTLRYPGHRERIKFLFFDLGLHAKRGLLKEILESAIPPTHQDRVVMMVSVVGHRGGGRMAQETFTRTVRHGEVEGRHWTAIQRVTASSVCAVADLAMRNRLPHRGSVRQEEIDLADFYATPYGAVFDEVPVTLK